MATAREIMHPQAECIDENETLNTAARMMRDLHVGSLPICGADGQLRGIITDRDLVVRCIAENGDPRTVTAGQLARGTPVCADADVDVSEVLRLMEQHAIRRLPVLDDDRLVGMISEADLATHLGEHEVAEFAADSLPLMIGCDREARVMAGESDGRYLVGGVSRSASRGRCCCRRRGHRPASPGRLDRAKGHP